MNQKLRFGLTLSIAISSLSVPCLALDDSTRAAARTLVNEGVTHFRASRYLEAQRKFLEAYAVAKVPTVAVWAGQAHEKMGKMVAAAEFYENALLMQPNELWVGNAQQQAQKQAEELLKEIKPRIPAVKIQLTGANIAEVSVSIDGMPVANALLAVERPLDPGTHEIAAARSGKTTSMTLTLAQAEKKSVALEAPASAAPDGRPEVPVTSPKQVASRTGESGNQTASGQIQRSFGWASVGVGVAGLAVGITAGVVVGVKRSSLHDDGCNGNSCTSSSFSSRVDSYNAWRTISTAGFIVGGIGMGLGVTLLLTSPRRESPTQIGLVMSPNAVGLNGAF